MAKQPDSPRGDTKARLPRVDRLTVPRTNPAAAPPPAATTTSTSAAEPAQRALFDDQPTSGIGSQGALVTSDELHLFESVVGRLRHAVEVGRVAAPDTITAGDVIQLRPGADPHWQTSLLLVCKVRSDGGISGQILRPHRGGYREAWYTYRSPEVAKVGRMPFPEPALTVRSASYWPPCPTCGRGAIDQPAERKPIESEKEPVSSQPAAARTRKIAGDPA